MQLVTVTSRRHHARQLHLLAFLLSLAALLASVQAEAQQRPVRSISPGIERYFVSPAKVMRDHASGADDIDRAARQYAALGVMQATTRLASDAPYASLMPPPLQEKMKAYERAMEELQKPLLARFARQNCSGPNCERNRFYDTAHRLERDPAFRSQVLKRYFSNDAFAALIAEENRLQIQAAQRAQMAQQRKDNESGATGAALGLLIAAGIAGLFFLFIMRQKDAQPAAPPLSGNYGTAAFAPVEQKPRSATAARTGVFLGRSWNPEWELQTIATTAPVYTKPESHTLVVAPTRTGKGTRIIIPTLLRYGGSVLTIDPKGENAAITARARQKLGQKVYLINPWGELSQEFAKRGFGASATYNPLDILDRRDPNVVANAQTLAEVICPPPQGDRDSYWQGSATELLCAILLWLTDQPDEQKTLGRARDIIGQSRKDMSEKFLTRMVESTAFDGAIRNFASPFIDLADQTYSSVISTLSVYTRFLSDPQVKASTAKSSFSMRELIDRDTSRHPAEPHGHASDLAPAPADLGHADHEGSLSALGRGPPVPVPD